MTFKDRADPWEEFHLDELKVEKAVRHHYSALNKTWSTEEVVVKMGNTSSHSHGKHVWWVIVAPWVEGSAEAVAIK